MTRMPRLSRFVVALVLAFAGVGFSAAAETLPRSGPQSAAETTGDAGAKTTAAAAATPLALRAFDHGVYGRLVFDWPRATGHTVTLSGRRLVVRFDRPFEASFLDAAKALRPYVAAIDAAPDGRTAILTLKGPVQYRSFTVGSAVALDLEKAPDKAADPDPRSTPRAVAVKAGSHADFDRLVFEFPTETGYRLVRDGDVYDIAFRRPGAVFDLADLTREDAPSFSVLDAGAGAGTPGTDTPFRFRVAPGATVRHFRLGPKIVVDIVRGRTSAATAGTGASAPAAPAVPAATAATPSAAGDPVPLVGRALSSTPSSATPSGPLVKVAFDDTSLGLLRLRFAWDEPVSAAVFRRAGALWIVFDKPRPLDVAALQPVAPRFDKVLDGFVQSGATVLRLGNPSDFRPSVQRDGQAWIVELKNEPARLLHPIDVVARLAGEGGTLSLPADGASGPFRLKDPEVGDTLVVIALDALGRGLDRPRRYQQFTLFDTAQGVAVESRTDDLAVTIDGASIRIGGDGPLFMSSIDRATAAFVPDPAGGFDDALLPVAAWYGDDGTPYRDKKRAIEAQLAGARGPDRTARRLDLARLDFAYGLAAESLGLVREAVAEDPRLLEQVDIRALRGASALLAGDLVAAGEDLSHPALDPEPDGRLWRGLLATERGEFAGASEYFHRAAERLGAYPPRFANRFTLAAAEAMIATGQIDTANAHLDALDGVALTPGQAGRWGVLRGKVHAAMGRHDDALALWQDLASGDDRRSRAEAELERVTLMHGLGQLDAALSAEALARLRFAWRGDRVEFAVLRRLGAFEREAGAYRNALAAWRDAVAFFPDQPETASVTADMASLFAEIFAENGAARDMTPLAALSLYEEFRELTPSGVEGDAMVRRLAERLVSVDLLAQAAALLDHQVRYRLAGVEKAEVGARLAFIHLLNRAPEAALAALAASIPANPDAGSQTEPQTALAEAPANASTEAPAEASPRASPQGSVGAPADMPPDLGRRRAQIEARALASLGRAADAVARLDGDDSATAELLRADIATERGRWRDAVRAYGRYVVEFMPRGDALSEDGQLVVLRFATALSMAGDDQGLDELRQRFGPQMAGGAYKNAFIVLTSAQKTPPGTMTALSERVAEAGAFSDFLGDYRARAKAAPESPVAPEPPAAAN